MTVTEPMPATDVVMSWPAPRWALTTEDEEGYVRHQRPIGRFTALGPGRTGVALQVHLIQNERLRLVDGFVRADRDDVEIEVGDERLSASEARRLAALLTEAVNLVQL